MNDEQARNWKETVGAYFKVPSPHSPGETKKNCGENMNQDSRVPLEHKRWALPVHQHAPIAKKIR
jgi:hypothetical protein